MTQRGKVTVHITTQHEQTPYSVMNKFNNGPFKDAHESWHLVECLLEGDDKNTYMGTEFTLVFGFDWQHTIDPKTGAWQLKTPQDLECDIKSFFAATGKHYGRADFGRYSITDIELDNEAVLDTRAKFEREKITIDTIPQIQKTEIIYLKERGTER